MAIADPGRQKDGFNGLPLGMDSSKAPNLIDKQSYALGVNVVARGGKVKTRPGFEQLDLQSDPADPDALSIFKSGYFQGACVYNQPVNRDEPSDVSQGGKDKSYIIAVVDGWIFRIDPQTKRIIRLNGNPGTSLTPANVVSLSAQTGFATATTSSPHNLSPGDKISFTGADPVGFNVTNASVIACPTPYSFQFSAPGVSTQVVVNTPNWEAVAALLHMDGANGSTVFTDSSSSPKTFTANGNASISTTNPQNGFGQSCFFDGTGDYLSASFPFNYTSDFTIEGWIKRTGAGTGVSKTIFAAGNIANGVFGLHLYVDANGTWSWNNAATVSISGGSAPLDQWVHFAAVRLNGSNTLYVNGQVVGTGTQTFLPGNNVVTLGGAPGWGYFFQGYMDEFRMTQAALYTAPFTPSSTPFTQTVTIATGGSGVANSVGAYTISDASKGYLKLPEFMDTTYYTLGVVGATKLTDGSGFTGSAKVLIEDEFPTGVTLGQTGSGFSASVQPSAGHVVSVTLINPGSGYSVNSPPAVTISGGGGSGAYISAEVNQTGSVSRLFVLNQGTGYTSAPTVTIASPGGNGVQATASVTISPSGQIRYLNVSNSGSGFSKYSKVLATESVTVNTAPRFARDNTASTRPWPDRNHETRRHYFAQTDKFLLIQDGINRPFIFDGFNIRRSYIEGNPALSRGTNSTGTIKSILISSRGSGYTANPTVTISSPGGAGTTATATASISASGQLNSITITNAGTGYTSQPTITITSSNGAGSGARAYSVLNPPKEVPIGSLMAYGQGRLFVANSNRFEIFALDLVGSHVNAATGTTSTGTVYYPMSDPRMSVILNTENTYLNEGGSLLAPSFMGKIVSLRVLPVQNTTAGQGQLFAFCEFGAASFKVSAARNSWGSTQDFQVVLFKDIGSVGPDAFAQVNGDLFFRSTDGLRSYRNASAEFAAYGNTGMSAEMDRFMKNEPIHLMYGATCGYSSEGRLLLTAIPQETQLADENSLSKLYFKAVVCLDFNSQNGSLGKTSAAYDGIWTGLDFVHILSGEFGRRPRTYFLAYSCNLLSLWEVNSKFSDDRPVGGVDLALSPAEMTGTRTTNTFGANSKTETQISLARYDNFKPDSLRLELTTTNAATGWTSAGMGTQGVTLAYAFSELDVPAAGALNNPAISPFIRTTSLLFSAQASGSAFLPIELGPEKTSGFLYVRVTALNSLPAGNTVSYNVALEGESAATVPIRCELETASFTFNDGFEEKRLIRSDLWLSDLKEQTDVEVYYRPDQYPSWLFWDQFSLLPETSIAIRPLPSDSIIKGAISSALPQDEYSVDLAKYATRLTRGLGFRFDFGIGSVAPGTGADPYSVQVVYQISNLNPAQKNALVVGTSAYNDFQNAYRTVSVPIPTTTGNRYINLFRPAGRYLYFKVVYPTIFASTSYELTINLFGLEQGGETPDQVLSGGFLGSLLNLYPQFAPQIRLMNPVEQPDPITGRLFSHGYEFQQRLVWTGNATLQKGYLHAMSLVEPVGGNSL